MMSFGAATEMSRRVGIVRDYKVLLIDLLDVPRMDTSAALALESAIEQAAEQKRRVIIIGMSNQVARLLTRLGAIDHIRDSDRFGDRASAVAAAVEWLEP
jgi:SulP family sulfate permease